MLLWVLKLLKLFDLLLLCLILVVNVRCLDGV